MDLTVKSLDGKDAGTVSASDAVFNAPLRRALLYQAMLVYRANQRQGTQSTKNRREVSGGGRKPWRQKHTGRARQGSTRSPQWRHGGVALGPKPRDYRQQLPKEMRRQALASALSDKVRNNRYTLVEVLTLTDGKTTAFDKLLKTLGVVTKCLVVTREPEEGVIRAARNLEGVRTTPANTLNALDLMTYDHVLLTTGAVRRIEELWAERTRHVRAAGGSAASAPAGG
ncbi:MAG: 50S ribosomal protein L4 [SAR202 cluster bacterium]|nr:50S ribosomal protein L4 [SAR202 cluster bacterium]